MATNKKITELTELGSGQVANDDVLALVDISTSTTKKIKVSTLRDSVAGVLSLTASSPLSVDLATGDVTISIPGPIAVNKGGTGAATFTDGGVLIGKGTAAFETTGVLADGTIIIGDGATNPTTLAAFSSATGTLAVAYGGSGAASHTDGGVLIGKGTAAFANTGVLADGTIIIGDGATDPVTLAAFSSSTGTLKVANGGTGAATLTANNVLLGNGTSAVQVVAPGTSGNVLTSNGTTWASTVPSGGGVTTFTAGTTGFTPSTATSGAVTLAGTLAVANGGTGVATITTGGLVVGAATSAVTSLNPATAGNSIIDSGTAWTSVAKNWSYRNLIINGEFKVAQRGTSIAMTTGEAYGLDQWTWNNNISGAGRVTVTQSTTVPNSTFAKSMKIDVTTVDTSMASGDQYGVFTHIEGLRSSRIGFGTAAAETVTVSFWIRVDSTDLTFPATFGGALNNSGYSRSYPFNFTVTASATWQKITVTVAGDVTGTWLQTTGQGLNLVLSFACGSTNAGPANTWATAQYYSATGSANFMNHVNNDLYLTGVQIEVGSIATPFEYRDYGEELQLCRRYFRRFEVAANNDTLGLATTENTNRAAIVLDTGAPIRAMPTVSMRGAAPTFNTISGTLSSINGAWPKIDSGTIVVHFVASGVTALQTDRIRFATATSDSIDATAEL